MPPETRYAKSGDLHIAYQVVGEGPLDLVLVHGWVSHIEHAWDYPPFAHCLMRLASFARLIHFDKRGTGLSDRVAELPSLEQRMDDLRAVMDAAGSEQAVLFGYSEGGPMAALFAATYPGRTAALIMYASYARRVRAPDYPWGPTPEERLAELDSIEQWWGRPGGQVATRAPSHADDPRYREWFATYLRRSASPGAALALARMNLEIDVRPVLPAIRVPTLILHRVGERELPVAGARYLATWIPGARYVELPGDDHSLWAGDSDAIIDEVEEFVTGVRPAPEPDRVLATVLFTDIVGSTQRAAALGDRRWRELLDAHHAAVRRELARFRGREVKTTGDGFLAAFDGPARAVRCAAAIRDAVRQLGIEIRAGLHTGEVELLGDDVGGIAVHIGARVAAEAGPGEVLVSSTVKDLVAGSGLEFDDRGARALKGVPGEWRLFAVVPNG
jgi:class 3 adenylate cyclase/alpha-beta hydrolase superfamily lysophospholipase